MSDNPLATRRAQREQAKPHPMMRHAQLWQHINNQPADVLDQHVRTMDYVLPVLGGLAADPKVTAKDVMKAMSNAVADKIIDPTSAVQTISQMPADPDKLRTWLREKYADYVTTTVHAKAAQMRAAPAAPASPAVGSDGVPAGSVPATNVAPS